MNESSFSFVAHSRSVFWTQSLSKLDGVASGNAACTCTAMRCHVRQALLHAHTDPAKAQSSTSPHPAAAPCIESEHL